MYYEFIFQKIAEYAANSEISGVSFLAWAWERRPKKDIWNISDDWIGDPPHEYQGWYSVYDTDTTVNVIKKYSKKFVIKYTIDDHRLKMDFWICIGVSLVLVIVGLIYDHFKRSSEKNDDNNSKLSVE